MAANEEFAAEVTRLYGEEEAAAGDRRRLEAELEAATQALGAEQARGAEQVARLEAQEARLLESVKLLSQDNARLIQDRDQEILSQSKSNQVLVGEDVIRFKIIFFKSAGFPPATGIFNQICHYRCISVGILPEFYILSLSVT